MSEKTPIYNMRHWQLGPGGGIYGVVEDHPVHGTMSIVTPKVLDVDWSVWGPIITTRGGSRYRLRDPRYKLHFEELCKRYPPPEAPDAHA